MLSQAQKHTCGPQHPPLRGLVLKRARALMLQRLLVPLLLLEMRGQQLRRVPLAICRRYTATSSAPFARSV